MAHINYVVEDENGNLVVIGCKGFKPNNALGIVPNSINKADYPYLVKIPIYDIENPELIIGYDFEVDEVAKAAEDPINGQGSGV